MTLEDLVEDAASVPNVPADVAARYRALSDELIARVNASLLARPDFSRLTGANPFEVMCANHAHHAAFLSDVLALGQHRLLARTLPWVYRSYRARGFSFDYFPVELEAWIGAIEACLPPADSAAIVPLYRWMLRRHGQVRALAEEPKPAEHPAEPFDPDPWRPVRERYLAALLAGDSAEALQIARAVSLPSELEPFFLSVLQPAMHAVGDRWEAGRLSVAQEHLASAITARVVAGLAMARKPGRPWRGRAIVTAAPNEFHELGAWMLADLLEQDGWDVACLGANTPTQDLLTLARLRRPAFVALSVTMPFNLQRTRELIAAFRAQAGAGRTRFLVGGHAFGLEPELWRVVGADAFAKDAHDAVQRAREFGEQQ